MPAAAVIPAPIAYINVVAVKKLVVGFLRRVALPLAMLVDLARASHPCGDHVCHSFDGYGNRIVYCEKIRVFKAGLCREYISME